MELTGTFFTFKEVKFDSPYRSEGYIVSFKDEAEFYEYMLGKEVAYQVIIVHHAERGIYKEIVSEDGELPLGIVSMNCKPNTFRFYQDKRELSKLLREKEIEIELQEVKDLEERKKLEEELRKEKEEQAKILKTTNIKNKVLKVKEVKKGFTCEIGGVFILLESWEEVLALAKDSGAFFNTYKEVTLGKLKKKYYINDSGECLGGTCLKDKESEFFLTKVQSEMPLIEEVGGTSELFFDFNPYEEKKNLTAYRFFSNEYLWYSLFGILCTVASLFLPIWLYAFMILIPLSIIPSKRYKEKKREWKEKIEAVERGLRLYSEDKTLLKFNILEDFIKVKRVDIDKNLRELKEKNKKLSTLSMEYKRLKDEDSEEIEAKKEELSEELKEVIRTRAILDKADMIIDEKRINYEKLLNQELELKKKEEAEEERVKKEIEKLKELQEELDMALIDTDKLLEECREQRVEVVESISKSIQHLDEEVFYLKDYNQALLELKQ